MRNLACATLVLLASACASAPTAGPLPGRHSTPSALQLARGPGGAEREGIGREDLEEARELLSRARDELEPPQWEALDRELSEAERAWASFSRAAQASGQAAEVARGAEGLTRAERARQAVGGLSRVGPLLVALGLLWPSSTAGPEEDSRPAWVEARREFEVRLRNVSEASRHLLEGLEAQSSPGEAMAAEPGPASEPAQGKGSPPAARTTGDCRPESNKDDADKHHIATDKNSISDASGGPWTPLFEDLFKRAGMDLQDPANIVYLLKHQGPHPRDYHEEIYRRLRDALAGCRTTPECRKRLVDELDRIAADICKPGSALNKLLTR